MYGLIIALIYGVIIYFFGEPTPLVQAYLIATNFLFWWYVVTSALQLIFVLLIFFGVIGGATLGGYRAGGALGAFFSSVGTGILSGLFLIFFTIKCACFIVGAHLLDLAVTFEAMVGARWDTTKLAAGGLLILLGLIMNKGGGIHFKFRKKYR